MPENVTSTINLTNIGKHVLASAWGFDAVSGNFVFRGIPFTGGGVSINTIEFEEGSQDIDIDHLQSKNGKVTHISTVRNRIRIIVRFDVYEEPIRGFTLNCMNSSTEAVFAFCNLLEPLTITTPKTVCFAFEVENSESGSLNFGPGSINMVTAEDLSQHAVALSQSISALETEISELSQRVENLSDLGSVTMESVSADEGTFTEVTTNVLNVHEIVPNNESGVIRAHIGDVENSFGFISSDVYLGRSAAESYFGITVPDIVQYPIGDSGKTVTKITAPDAFFRSISSTPDKSESQYSEIVLQGYKNDTRSEASRCRIVSKSDEGITTFEVTPTKVTVSGDASVSNIFVTDGLKADHANLGQVYFSGKTISVKNWNPYGTDQLVRFPEITFDSSILPSGDSRTMGTDPHRWSIFASKVNTQKVVFKTPPTVMQVSGSSTKQMLFPAGCTAMLTLSTQTVNAGDSLDGTALNLQVWFDRGSTNLLTLVIKTTNKFIALSGAVAGRPFLALCVE